MVVVEVFEVETQARQPEGQIRGLPAVNIKRTFLHDEGEALPGLQLLVGLFDHCLCDFAIDDAFDILKWI